MQSLEELPNLKHLNGFLAVADCAVLSIAAQRIGLSQPALTQAVAGLETALGVALFARRSGGMVLTEPGRIFAERVRLGVGYLKGGFAPAGHKNLHHLVTGGQLRALIATVEQGGFSAGAAALKRQVSTVNRACRHLERLVGIALFEQTSVGTRATLQAEELSRAAKLALNEFRQAHFDVKCWQGEFEGRLAIGSLPLVQTSILPEAVSRFASEYPRVLVSVLDGRYASLARALRRGDLDLILGALRSEERVFDLSQEALFRDSLVVVADPRHPLAVKSGRAAGSVTTAALAAYPWIMPREGAPARAHFEALHASLDPPAHVSQPIETGSHSFMLGLLRTSQRITLVSVEQVKRDIELGLLVRIYVALEPSQRTIGVTTRCGWVASLPQKRFLEILRSIVPPEN